MKLDRYRGLYGIVDINFAKILSPEEWTKIFVDAGVKIIQLRAKKVSDKEFLFYAEKMRKIIPEDYCFIVNDRVDVALLTGADGVHVGQEDIPIEKIRGKWQNIFLGLSTHNLSQLTEAQHLPVDYLGFGPVFPTTSKDKPDPVVGVDNLERANKISRKPVVAIGGITSKNLPDILSKTCPDMFAVVSAIAKSDDPGKEVQKLQKIFTDKCAGVDI